jgi:acyl carrier protein
MTSPPLLTEDEFCQLLTQFIKDRVGGSVEVDANTHLWERGYLDSFALLELVVWLEELTGRRVELGPDSLERFFTIGRIYEAYVSVGPQ